MNFLATLFAGLGGTITAVVNGWQTRATARVEAEVKTAATRAEAEATILVARATAATRLAEGEQAGEIAWDLEVASQMRTSLKDEYLLGVLSLPLILAFVAPSIVDRGFAALDGMPAYYFAVLGTAVASTFGVKKVISFFDRTGRR